MKKKDGPREVYHRNNSHIHINRRGWNAMENIPLVQNQEVLYKVY